MTYDSACLGGRNTGGSGIVATLRAGDGGDSESNEGTWKEHGEIFNDMYEEIVNAACELSLNGGKMGKM